MPGAGGISGAEYGSDAYTNAMRMMAMGQILQGGNGGSYFNYMQQMHAAKQADAQRAAAAMAAQEEEARQQAMMQAAQAGMSQFFGSQMPNPVQPFNNNSADGASVAADAMAYVKPELFPGLSQDTINMAARTNAPAASALIKMFYDMPDDMGQRTRAGYEDGQATFAYNDQEARDYARESAPDYGYGFSGDMPNAQFGAQQSMPTPIAPERMSQIMMNPMIPKEVKEQVMARFQQAEPKMQWIDGVGMVDMNNPPPELMVGKYQDTADMTGNQKDYEYYAAQEERAGRQPLSFGQWLVMDEQAASGQGRYIYGSDAGLPQGWRMDTATGQAEPIPGGPAAQEAASSAEQAAMAEDQKATGANIVMDDISIARDLITENPGTTTGMVGGQLSRFDWTKAGALKNRLLTIKANLGFDKLQAMRDASPTGGALGQVSEFENRLLQSVFGSLEQSQTSEDLLYNLDRLESIYNRVINEGISAEEARGLYREIEGGGTEVGGTDATPAVGFTTEEARNVLSGLSKDELDRFQKMDLKTQQTYIRRKLGR